MTTTTQLRDWWSPPCVGPLSKVALHGAGIVSVRSSIVEAVHALSACLAAHDYPTRQVDTGAYNCRQITGGTRYSLHAYGIAIDINWQSNPYGPVLVTDMPPAMVAAIKAIRTRNGRQVWRWGGDYAGNKDAMHFEVTCHPADIETGIDPATVPGEGDDMPISEAEWKRIGDIVTWVVAAEVGNLRKRLDDVQTKLAALQRRVLGVPLMADGTEQHKADEDTGRRLQALLGD